MSRFAFCVGVNLSKVEGGAAEKIKAAGLDFRCEKRPALYHPDPLIPTEVREVPNQYHIVRTDTNEVISEKTVSSKFKILQNADAFSFIDSSSVISEIDIVRGGTFQRGANVFMLGKYPLASTLPDGNVIEHLILLGNGHTGKKNLSAKPLNISAKNGAIISAGAYADKLQYNIRHTTNMQVNMNDVLTAIKHFKDATTDFLENAKLLCSKACTKAEAVDFFKSTMDVDDTEDSPSRQKNAVEKYEELFNACGTANWWNAYQSLCEYITFDRSSKSNKTSGVDSASNRLYGAMYGATANIIDLALVKALRSSGN